MAQHNLATQPDTHKIIFFSKIRESTHNCHLANTVIRSRIGSNITLACLCCCCHDK